MRPPQGGSRELAIGAIVARILPGIIGAALALVIVVACVLALRVRNVWVEPTDCGAVVRWGWYDEAARRGESGGWRWCDGTLTDVADGSLIWRIAR